MIPNVWSPTWNSKNASPIGFSLNSKNKIVQRPIRKETPEYGLSDGGDPESHKVQVCDNSMLVAYILKSASSAKTMFYFPRSVCNLDLTQSSTLKSSTTNSVQNLPPHYGRNKFALKLANPRFIDMIYVYLEISV